MGLQRELKEKFKDKKTKMNVKLKCHEYFSKINKIIKIVSNDTLKESQQLAFINYAYS